MQYAKYKPDPALAPFVECYYHWEGETVEPLDVQSPPNGFCAMVVNEGDVYFSSQGSDARVPVPRAFVSGQFTSNYRLHLHGKISMIGVVLKPASVHNWFGIRMSELVNSRVALNFLPGMDGDTILNRVSMADTVTAKHKVMEELLLGNLEHGKRNLSIIDEAIEFIDQCKGCSTVDDVANQLRISRRYLEKKFLEKVGLSPKYYARIRRFSILSNEIAHNKQIDWQHVVTQYGFHDQSHLFKEFMEFNQMNPTQYHLVHREMTRFVGNVRDC